MYSAARTRSQSVGSGAKIPWLFAALLLPAVACERVEPSEPAPGEQAQQAAPPAARSSAHDISAGDITSHDVAAPAASDGEATAVGAAARAAADRRVASDPIVQSFLNESPAYLRYRAFVERRQQLAAQAAAAPAPNAELPASEPSENELSAGDIADATVEALVLPPGSDDLATYANRCDAATGIHVPAFNCNAGTDIPQGVIQTTLTDININLSGGSRAAATPTVTSNEITSAGADIWNNADSFFFSYATNLPGGNSDGSPGGVDGYAEVYVSSLQNTHAFAKAGIMFRGSTAAGAVNVMLAITPTSGAEIQKRTAPNGTSTNEFLTGKASPTWLRLLRRTNTFTGFVSTDRITWTQVGSPVTLTGFTSNPLVGLAVSSHVAGVSAQAVFDRFSWTPLAAFSSCDQPNALHGRCDPGSRFQVLAQTPDATVVANCRKQNFSASATANEFGDIAVIQLNKQTGAMCFYQAYAVGTANLMPAPSTGSGPWLSPTETHAGGCTGCHDNGGFIRSPYLFQLEELPNMVNLLPNWDSGYDNDSTPLHYVGSDFVADRSWSISTPKDTSDDPGESNCNGCHRLAVNNNVNGSGTAAHIALLATEETYGVSVGAAGFKTPHGPTAPIWMRPGQVFFQAGANATAQRFSSCATSFWTGVSGPGFTFGNPSAGDNCTYEALATPFEPFADSQDFTDVNIGISAGTRTPNGMVQTLKAAGADIYNTADQFLYSYKLLAGDGSATVKVTGLTNTNAFAKAGIMFRDGTGPSAVNAMVEMTPTSGAQFQYRNAVGGNTTSLTLSGQTIPRWLKISRAGRTFVGYVSPDQEKWTQVGTPVTLPIGNFPPNSLALVGLAATSHNAPVQTTATFDHFAWLPASPDTLLDANIGITNGSHSFRAGTHTILAGGSDIYNAADQFFYAFESAGGTGSIVATVTSLTNTDPYAKAGVMYRGSALDNSANVMVEITATQGASFQYRPVLGANTVSINVPGYSAPRAVRLDREAGGVFKGYVQENDLSWTLLGSVTLPSFNDPALAGLAVTSHNTGAVATGTFTDVDLP